MRRLDSVRVRLEAAEAAEAPPAIGNALPILHEVAEALERLVTSGETAVIDLRALPLAPGDRERLQEMLGPGELSARLEAFGPSAVRETDIHGVWWVTHYNAEDEIMAEFIEVTPVPEILQSDLEDAADAVDVLRERLAAAPEAGGDAYAEGGEKHV